MATITKEFRSKKYGLITVTQRRRLKMFHFTTSVPVEKDEARIIQIAMNYHPHGYGFNFKAFAKPSNKWSCNTSCD